jgi:hypothetical protein
VISLGGVPPGTSDQCMSIVSGKHSTPRAASDLVLCHHFARMLGAAVVSARRLFIVLKLELRDEEVARLTARNHQVENELKRAEQQNLNILKELIVLKRTARPPMPYDDPAT